MGICDRWRFQKILGPCATKSLSLSLTVASGEKSPPTTARHRHQHRSHHRPPRIPSCSMVLREMTKYTPLWTLVHPSSCAGIGILPFIFHHSSMTLCRRPFTRGRHERQTEAERGSSQVSKQRFFTSDLSLVPACR
jgi:hypothetical protein